MYYDFFGFREPPFSIAPDPRSLYLSERHKEALAHLMYGVQGQGGFIVITGEVGTGKTTISRCFIENCWLRSAMNWALPIRTTPPSSS